jgi:Fe-S-cluster containining protein
LSEDSPGPAAKTPSLELPLVDLPRAHPCADCGQCCTYVATQIDDPTTFKEYENLFWYLAHENVAVYIDWEGEWYLEFQTRCRNLTDARTCAIYAERPLVCSEFSFEDCEKNSGEQAWKHYFRSFDDLLGFMQAKRPKAFARYAAKRRALLKERARSAASQPSRPAPRARR